ARSWPAKTIWLSGMTRPGRSTSPMIERAVTVFPQPDSPTRHRVSPSLSEKSTPSTARITPARCENQVRRFRTSSRGPKGTRPLVWAAADEAHPVVHGPQRGLRGLDRPAGALAQQALQLHRVRPQRLVPGPDRVEARDQGVGHGRLELAVALALEL